MSTKTCSDCIHATKKNGELFYCDLIKWTMNIKSPECIKKKENEIMGKVKLSTLSKDTIVLVDGYSLIDTVEDILEDLEGYKTKKIYTTTEYKASFDAKRILDDAIEYQQENGMYEDWDDSIKGDITQEDIKELQAILDRILSRSPMANIAYESDKLIEIDM